MRLDEQIAKLETELQEATDGLKPINDETKVSEEMTFCHKHGEFKQFSRVLIGLNNLRFKKDTRCPQCIREEIQALKTKKAELEETVKTMKIEQLKKISKIPKRFVQSSFENYQETAQNNKAKRICKAYADRWIDRKENGGGLILCGKPGTGKNHLACAIINQVIEKHQDDARLTTALRIARNVKSTWGRESEVSEAEVIRDYIEPELLVIDEIGVQFGSEAEKIILFEIINTRYEDMKPTILISNLSEIELSDYVGERIVDRMREGGGAVIAFDWESHRK